MNAILEKSWRKALLPVNATIQQAIQNLNDAAIKIVLIVNDNDELLGTLSDGDIRRGLLKGLTLTSPITDVIKRNPMVAPVGVPRELVLQLMTANRIQQIPVVDAQNHLVGLHLWDDISTPLDRQNLMVIMAGGQGARLRPHTERCPKPMLLVRGKPMLEHIIVRAKQDGFSHFVLAIHYMGQMIEDYFADGSRLKVRVDYLKEESPLGTAGALSLLNPSPELSLVVTNGDVMTDIHYGELLNFHERYQATATMAVRVHEWQHPFGVVRMKGVEIVDFEEKPITRNHINAGVYALDPTALELLETGEYCDMPTLFGRLRTKGWRTVAYPTHEPWLDVGQPDDLAKANG